MPRIIAIDYGARRCGLATTDPLQIIATALGTFEPGKLLEFLKDYFLKEEIAEIVVGLPVQRDGNASDIEMEIQSFIEKLKIQHPTIPIKRMNEAFTSKLAKQSLIDSGVKKKDRRKKGLLDSVSATLILQDYLASR